jgi:tetratricopeptide (TPR) repeat protein
VLGDYRLLREIGRGGMAVVYEAEQISLGRTVALKVLPFAAVLDPKHLQRFKNEAQAAAHLHHPHIVPVYAVGCERGVHYYAMQYVEGQSLAVAIRDMVGEGSGEGTRTPISSHGSNREPAYIRMAAALGVQAAEALEHAHQLGIVHRDVKPGNLLVDLAGTLWVTDFGLAHSLKDVGLTITGELLGTIRYMSPEQALAKRVPIDHRTDIYSLGVTLYELLTLEPAFRGDDPHLVLQDIALKEPVLPRRLNPALPRDLETVLLKAMSKDPGGRYATAQEMADDLGRYLENRAVEAKRPGPLRRVVKWSQRHGALVRTAAGVLLLAVAGLAIGAALLWREKERTTAAFERAEANLTLALKALDQIYIDEAEGHPRIRGGLPRDLLERGLGFYEAFVKENARSNGLLGLMGFACHRAGLIFRKLGEEERAVQSLDRALSAYDRAIEADPRDAAAHNNRANALGSLGRLEEALAELDRAIEVDPRAALPHNTRFVALRDLGRFEEALAACDRAIELDPRYASAHLNRGVALRDLGRWEEALRAYDRAIELDPGDARAHNARGALLCDSLGRPGDAVAEFDRAIELDSLLAHAHTNRGNALHRLGRFEEGLAAFDRAIEIDPRSAVAHTGRGFMLQGLRRFKEALAASERAIGFDARYAMAHTARGNALGALGELDASIGAFREAIRLQPDLPEAYCNLGFALKRRGHMQEALSWLRKGHELGSKRPDWVHPSKEWVDSAERQAELESRLDRVLSGERAPRDAPERIEFATLLQTKSRHAESAQMWAQAFAEDAAIAEDLAKSHRYNAACSAALAAARGGADAAECRRRALHWLRADLAARNRAATGLVTTLEHWKRDPDLASIRDRPGDLPESEREPWQRLWAAVDEALATARKASR